MRDKYMEPIRSRIKDLNPGELITSQDFIDIATYDSIRKALSRFVKEGTLQRILTGIYIKPNYNEVLKIEIPAKPNDVAEAIARKNNWSIIPKGDSALNYLGLTTQVPAVYSYRSTGPTKKYKYGKTTIEMHKRGNKYVSGMSKMTGIVIEALKVLGINNITDKQRKIIFTTLSNSDLNRLYEEGKNSDIWIYEEIINILKMGGYDVRNSKNVDKGQE
jgi:hypothetical protein